MPKHAFNKTKFKVKIQYRPGKTRGVIALPAPVLYVLNNCDYIELELVGEGQVVLRAHNEKADTVAVSRTGPN